jgi:serine/threonine protein kinase
LNIPGFKLGRQYASGHYCKFYSALNLSDHKTVTIQVFDNSLLMSRSFVDHFREITGKLAGARFGIMTPVLQAEISNQTCYVISEHFPAPQQLPTTPPSLTRDQVMQFALQLAQTLDQLHKAGLVHGGIEYSSLHLRAPDQLILRPVALQRAIPMLRSMTFKSLEPVQRLYLAPEASEALTPASDFYALGVLLYQLIVNPSLLDTAAAGLPETWPLEGEHQDLEPFFRHQLAANASDRIQSFDQFISALEPCGLELPLTAPAPAKTTHGQRHEVDAGETASRTASKWILPAAGLTLAALAGTLFLTSPGEETSELPDATEIAASDTAKVETDTVEQAPTPAKEQPAETSPNLTSLYQQALNQEELDPEAALQSVNLVLEQQPEHLEASRLKQRIERELSTRALIATAERQLQELKLLQPSGDNAYESYLTLADMLSADDERVRRGFTRIAAACHDQAENLFERNLLDKAQEYVELGLSVTTDYPPLLNLRIRINEQKSALARKKRLARLERQRREQRLDKQRQQEAQKRLLEQQQREALERQEEEQALKAEQLARQQEARQMQQARVEALLISANGYLNSGELSLENVFSAHRDYEELHKLDHINPDVSQLRKDLIEAYSILAIRQNSDELYQLALQALEQGVQLNPRERRKLKIRSQLSR